MAFNLYVDNVSFIRTEFDMSEEKYDLWATFNTWQECILVALSPNTIEISNWS